MPHELLPLDISLTSNSAHDLLLYRAVARGAREQGRATARARRAGLQRRQWPLDWRAPSDGGPGGSKQGTPRLKSPPADPTVARIKPQADPPSSPRAAGGGGSTSGGGSIKVLKRRCIYYEKLRPFYSERCKWHVAGGGGFLYTKQLEQRRQRRWAEPPEMARWIWAGTVAAVLQPWMGSSGLLGFFFF